MKTQSDKDAIFHGVREAVGRIEDFAKLDRSWLNGLKLHAATMAFTEFGAGMGDIRAARFGRDSAWRTMALFGALDEFRHTQIPLLLMHELVGWDPQFDWTHRLFHTNNWIAIAMRHVVDEMCVGTDPLEFAIATNLVLRRALPTSSSSGSRQWPTTSATGCSRKWSRASRPTRRATPRSVIR